MFSYRLFCFVLVLGFTIPCFAQSVTDVNKRFTADVLKDTLFARTDEDKQFCDYVIQKRDDGTIPTQIIYGIYQKAMTKERNQRFFYFKTALEIVCKRQGIVLNSTPSQTTPAKPFFALPTIKGLFQRN